MTFKFCAKPSIDEKAIMDKKHKGFEFIELYTNNETFNNSNESIKQRLKNVGVKTLIVHAPQEIDINNKINDSGISSINDNLNTLSIDQVKKTIDLADYICELEDRLVVVHPASQVFLDKSYDNIFKMEFNQKEEKIREIREKSINNTVKNLNELLSYAEKRNIKICLENMPSIDYSNNKNFATYGGFVYAEDFKELFDKVNSPNLGITLDVCHLVSQARMMKMMYQLGQTIGCNLVSDIRMYQEYLMKEEYEIHILEDFLTRFKDKIGVIHLNNTVEFGMVDVTHSIAFSEKDESFLTKFFDILKSIDYKNPITLEIREPNFYDAKELERTYNVIKKILATL